MGGKFAKCDAKVGALTIPDTYIGKLTAKTNESVEHAEIQAHLNPCGMNMATWLDQYHLDEYAIAVFFCYSDVNCEVDTKTHYTLCFKCRSSSDPTLGWWGRHPHSQQTTTCSNGVSAGGSSVDEDIFHTEGSAVQDILTGANVLEKLMVNGSRTKLAKRARRLVSVHNHTALWKDEPKAVLAYANNQRNKD